MERPRLDDVPRAALPMGYTIRPFRPTDAKMWHLVQAAADEQAAVSPALFGETFGVHEQAHRARILMACDAAGAIVGTAAAWPGDPPLEAWGRVHQVAVLPAHRNRGVGRALVAAACERLRQIGHAQAYLTVSPARLAAIHVYDEMGFVPRIQTAADRRVWRAVAAAALAAGRPLGQH